MRICHITSGHSPADDRIFYKEARSLAKKYNDVWIISPHAEKIPFVKDGVNFMSISRNSNSWWDRLNTMRELYKAALILKADIYHCHEPESLAVATKLKKNLGCKIIFDSHEMWSASIAQRYPQALQKSIISIYNWYEKEKIHDCDYVLGASWAISEYLESIIGSDRTATILNCTAKDVFGEAPDRRWDEETIICHDGHLPFSRGLKTMVKAVGIVSKKHPVKFKIVGDVFGAEKEWLEFYIKKHNLHSVIIRTGWLDYRNVGHALSECHIGLIALKKLPNNIVTSANKEFNYLYYGIPFISPDFRLSTNRLISEEKCGVSADSASAESYAIALSYMIQNRDVTIKMGLNAKRASQEKYRWSHMEKKLYDIYDQLCK